MTRELLGRREPGKHSQYVYSVYFKGRTVWGLNPGTGGGTFLFSDNVQADSGAIASSYLVRTGFLPQDKKRPGSDVNPLNAELNPICHLLALLVHHFLHVSRIRVKSVTLRLLMSYIYIWSTYS